MLVRTEHSQADTHKSTGNEGQASKLQATPSLALRTTVIAPRFSACTPPSAPKPLCRPSTTLKAIFFLVLEPW